MWKEQASSTSPRINRLGIKIAGRKRINAESALSPTGQHPGAYADKDFWLDTERSKDMAKNGESGITVEDVVDYLRLTGQFKSALHEVVSRKVAARIATDRGYKVTSSELQKAVDAFRVTEGLHKVSDTSRWLRANGVTLEALEEHLQSSLLVSKLKDALEKGTAKTKVLASEPVRSIVREAVFHDFIQNKL